MTLQITTWTVSPFAEHPYLIACAETGQAIFVDPGDQPELLWQAVIDAGVQLTAIVLTHAHLDHVGAVEPIRRRVGVPVYVHPADDEILAAAPGLAQMYGWQIEPVAPADHPLADGDTITVGNTRFTVLHTPGHSPGSVCLYAPDERLLIGGDTLFARSVGRTDLPGGDGPTLIRSIQQQLWPLPDDVRVLPGHGPATTIGDEKRLNPFVGVNASWGR